MGGRSQVQAPCLLVAPLLTIGGREDWGRGGLWGKKEAEGAVCPSAPLNLNFMGLSLLLGDQAGQEAQCLREWMSPAPQNL